MEGRRTKTFIVKVKYAPNISAYFSVDGIVKMACNGGLIQLRENYMNAFCNYRFVNRRIWVPRADAS